jgi:hypothetical protein
MTHSFQSFPQLLMAKPALRDQLACFVMFAFSNTP